MQLVATPAKLTADHTAKGASTSSDDLNAQLSPRTDEEYNLPYLKTNCKSTSTVMITATTNLMQYDDWKSGSEWTLSVP